MAQPNEVWPDVCFLVTCLTGTEKLLRHGRAENQGNSGSDESRGLKEPMGLPFSEVVGCNRRRKPPVVHLWPVIHARMTTAACVEASQGQRAPPSGGVKCN